MPQEDSDGTQRVLLRLSTSNILSQDAWPGRGYHRHPCPFEGPQERSALATAAAGAWQSHSRPLMRTSSWSTSSRRFNRGGRDGPDLATDTWA